MDAAIIGLIGTGVGGAIGALTAIASGVVEHRHQRVEDRRRELIDMISRLWDTSDRWWRASQGLEHAVIGLQGAQGSGNYPVIEQYEKWRLESFDQQHQAELAGRLIAAQLRLLHRPLAAPATALLDASGTYGVGNREEHSAIRTNALEAFEQIAQQELVRAGKRRLRNGAHCRGRKRDERHWESPG